MFPSTYSIYINLKDGIINMSVPEGYTAVPVAVLDSTTGNTEIIASVGLVFSKQLSLSKLEESWYQLVRVWPLVAARVRVSNTATSGIAYHVPDPAKLAQLEATSRSSSEPLRKMIVTRDVSDRSIQTYSNFSKRITSGQLSDICLGTGPNPKLSRELTCINATRTFDQLLEEDQSFVTAQATLFSDATIVSISLSHIIGDGFGLHRIWKAWSGILKGHMPEALQDLGKDPFIDYLAPEGPLSKNVDGSPLPDPKGWYKFGFLDKVNFAARVLWELHVARPEKKIGQYYVYLPEERVQQLVQEAQSQVDAHLESSSLVSEKEAGDIKKVATVKLSRLNVLFAWLIQNTQAARKNQKRLSSVLAICNTKGRPATGYRPEMDPAHPFWGGAVAFPVKPLSSAEFVSMPLGVLALHIRESLADYTDPDNMQYAITMLLNNTLWKNRKKPAPMYLFAKPNHYWSGMTDWRPVKFGATDFGGALPQEAQADVSQEVLKPDAINADLAISGTKRYRWALMGEAGKGCWFTGFMTHKDATHPRGFGRYPLYQ